ncbi:MAG: phosphatase PAP2 family protein [Saprospiraceae bacterium]|nr:phosphatase PAP2 family protein [Saprospiraceae bacterium]
MAWWQTLDFEIFSWINGGLGNPVFDAVLPLVREKWFWAPLYLFLIAFAIQNYSASKALAFLLGLALVIALSDFTSSTLIKKNVQRLRPCNDPQVAHLVHLRLPACGSGYSFTSSHAANHFAVATFVVAVLGTSLASWAPVALYGWAFLIAFSQVYVGVHYPGDVFFGSLLGIGIGRWTFFWFNRRGYLPSGK